MQIKLLSKNIWRVFITTNKMLLKRNYIIDKNIFNIDYDTFSKKYLKLSDLHIITKKSGGDGNEGGGKSGKSENEGSGEYIEVHFLEDIKEESKVGIKPIRVCIDDVKSRGNSHIIIIAKEGITPAALVKIEEIIKGISSDPDNDTNNTFLKINIETFKYTDLEIDITEHHLVPKHVLMSVAEKKDFLEKNSYKEQQLPKLLITDAVSRFYGFKKSDLIRIERISETAGIYNTYRIVS